ncbi:MAG: hypothetical protein PHW60_03665 [Kiritimatiellae bacterium]|nr:hypothetical protein [Kiritimatiellia bacterium]
MAYLCESCREVYESEESMAVFKDMPVLDWKEDAEGMRLSGECPLCGGMVLPTEDKLPETTTAMAS